MCRFFSVFGHSSPLNAVPCDVAKNDSFIDSKSDNKASELREEQKNSEIAVVHAQVSFADCPRESLSSKELTSVEGILFRLDHMKQNLKSKEFGRYSTRRSDDGVNFTHTLDLKLFVATERLWETARSYIWRHMGQYTWTLHDGTQVTMNRIHVKR